MDSGLKKLLDILIRGVISKQISRMTDEGGRMKKSEKDAECKTENAETESKSEKIERKEES